MTKSKHSAAVATTGCAGYGVAVAEPAQSFQVDVKAVHFGTGGFAVGVVKASWKGPFKSLRKNPNCPFAIHCDGTVAQKEKDWAECGLGGYEEGDVVGIFVGGGKVKVSIDGQVVKQVSVPKGERLALAVQPFMGGVARIVRADVIKR
ncbi:hypothetical protein TeGR_g3740 [Tetraparma gracilis]|uniref:Uncharacterized protein n=1 Tax=Tetraparma gracilis TaxID=2962635 RepID=A0ABQ6N542_9STRA|nr:hypothetical protein TeGR_g3740 [Tetraparma gracilis]